jgi:hypothetical protein
MARYDYKLATGYDNEAGFTNVEDALPTYNGRQTFYPVGRANFDEGTLRVRADGEIYAAGFDSFVWELNILTYAQWAYLQTNYCTGGTGYSGLVTARTRLIGGTYSNYNAVMHLPKPPEEEKKFVAMRNVIIRFVQAEAT